MSAAALHPTKPIVLRAFILIAGVQPPPRTVPVNPPPKITRRFARPTAPEVWCVHICNGQFTLKGQEGPVTYRLANPRADLPRRINGIVRMHREFPTVAEVHTYGTANRLRHEGTAIVEA